MGLRDWWRRRRGGGGSDAERSPTDATVLVGDERGAEDATLMVDSGAYRSLAARLAEPAAGARTEAVPGLAEDRLGRPAPAPGLAPTEVQGAVAAGRPRVVGVVVAVEGEFEGRAFPLFEGVNRIGREHVCEICLPSERVAPQHVCIEYRAGFFRLECLAEPEVRVNFAPVESALLRDGDALQLGMTTFRFRSIVGA